MFVNMIGTYAVTTRVYAVIFAQVCFMLISAVSQATAVLVGYAIGARDFEEANRLNNHVLKVFTPITIGITLVLAVFAKPLYGLFSTDPQVIALGQKIMCIEVILEIGRCFNIVLVRDLQAVGDVRYPVTIGIISQWVVAVGVAWLLGMKLGLGLAGIWMAFAMDECLRAIIFWARWKSGRWKDLQTV